MPSTSHYRQFVEGSLYVYGDMYAFSTKCHLQSDFEISEGSTYCARESGDKPARTARARDRALLIKVRAPLRLTRSWKYQKYDAELSPDRHTLRSTLRCLVPSTQRGP